MNFARVLYVDAFSCNLRNEKKAEKYIFFLTDDFNKKSFL